MKKKIVIAGLLGIQNYGDNFIAKCVEYLVLSYGEEYETVFLDMDKNKKDIRFLLCGFIKLIAYSIPVKNVFNRLIFFASKIYLEKYYNTVLKNASAVIFAGGSFKYGTQRVWVQYSIICECAEKLKIPVMFDAMNIQKYDPNDWRCQCLKKHANKECVKMITSRDGQFGVNRLKKDYILNSRIRLLPVGDPAFWIHECYKITKKEGGGKKIGINLIRGDIYEDYKWARLSSDRLIDIYIELLESIDKGGDEWELFTNGLKEDYQFGYAVLERYGCPSYISKIKVPQNDEDLVKIIAQYKGVIGGRLHACICAYALDIPIAGFVWDEKVKHFVEMSCNEEHFFANNDFGGGDLYNKIRMSINTKVDVKIKEKWKQSTKESIGCFLDFIDK